MDELAQKQYEWTRTWFEYTNGQTYNSNGWAIAAAFAIFIFVMKDARDRLMVVFGIAASVLLVVFAGLTAAGWAGERDAAYENLKQLEANAGWTIVSQDPEAMPGTRRTGTFGARQLKLQVDILTLGIVAGFVLGGWLRFRASSRANCDDRSG